MDFHRRVRALRPAFDAAIARVLDSGHFILGPEGSALEAELATYFDVPHVVAVANGTEALELALAAAGIGPGDDVLTTPLTAAFTSLAILRCGARPIFVDVDPETLTLDPSKVGAAWTPATKAIVPVHLYGHPADLDPLLALAAERGATLIEDACQAHGARYRGRRVGGIAGLGALSFYPTKNLGGFGDGGAVLVRDADQAARIRRLRNGGQSSRYEHVEAGMNSRLDEIQAALLRVGLKELDSWTARRRQLAAIYREGLSGTAVRLPVEKSDVESVYHLFVIRHPERDRLATVLQTAGIGTLIHYPIPLHRQPAFASLWDGRPLPITERACTEILSLPLYPELTDAEAESVVRAVRTHA